MNNDPKPLTDTEYKDLSNRFHSRRNQPEHPSDCGCAYHVETRRRAKPLAAPVSQPAYPLCSRCSDTTCMFCGACADCDGCEHEGWSVGEVAAPLPEPTKREKHAAAMKALEESNERYRKAQDAAYRCAMLGLVPMPLERLAPPLPEIASEPKKGWMRKVGRECQLKMAAIRKIEIMSEIELEFFTRSSVPTAEVEKPIPSPVPLGEGAKTGFISYATCLARENKLREDHAAEMNVFEDLFPGDGTLYDRMVSSKAVPDEYRTISIAGVIRDDSQSCGWRNARAEKAEEKLAQLQAVPADENVSAKGMLDDVYPFEVHKNMPPDAVYAGSKAGAHLMLKSYKPVEAVPVGEGETGWREIVMSELEGTSLTPEFVNDALDCAGHSVIRDSVMLGIAERIAKRLLQSNQREQLLQFQLKDMQKMLRIESDAALEFQTELARLRSQEGAAEAYGRGYTDGYTEAVYDEVGVRLNQEIEVPPYVAPGGEGTKG